MTVYLSSQYGTVMNPTGTDDDFLRRVYRSPTGRFLVTTTEHILTLFCISTLEISVIDSMDVAAICESAGGKFSHTEGNIDRVVWSPDESLMFVSTQDTLMGVVKISPSQEYPRSTSFIDDDEGPPVPRPDLPPFDMKLETVLLLPIKHFLITPSNDFLMVISRHSRLLLLIDWVNYSQRAKRFILPDISDHHGLTGSHSPINSVLPMKAADAGEALPPTESSAVVDAAVSDLGDSLVIVYDTGIVRLFSISSPTFPVSALVACPSALSVCCCNNLIAIVTKQAVYCYIVSHGTHYKLKWVSMLKNPITGISSCPQGKIFSLHHSEGIDLVDENGRTVLTYHEPAGVIACTISTWFKLLPIIRPRSPTIEFLPLAISASLLTNQSDDFHNQLVITRDDLRLFVFPSRQWRFIPIPALSEQGHIGTCAVQINPTSTFIVSVPVEGNGFNLWSAFSSPLVAQHKRSGIWEYFGDKLQEDQIGKIEFTGFVSETVFITKTCFENELVLWSVLKRIDVNHIIGRIPLASSGPIIASATKSGPRGYFAAMYRGKIDLYKLTTTTAPESYSLDLVQKIVTDSFPFGRICLVAGLHESTTTVIVVSNADAYTPDGIKIASNVSQVFSAPFIGSQIKKETIVKHEIDSNDVMGHTNPPLSSFSIDDENCPLCDRLLSDNVFERSAIPSKDAVDAIHRENPLVWFYGTNRSLTLSVIIDLPEKNCVETIGRFSDETSGHSVIAISGQFGILAIVDNVDFNRISFASAIHPLLLVLPSPFDTWMILKRLEAGSAFLALIVEIWIHCAISNTLPILSVIDKQTNEYNSNSLTIKNESLCGHSLVMTVLRQLHQSLWIASHFMSVFPSTFAASVRKTEPHLLFPLTMGGSLIATPCEQLFDTCVSQKRYRDAALLLLILQEKYGPIEIREKFVALLFSKCLKQKDYSLCRDLASFHLSYERSSSLLISPTSRFGWTPVFATSSDLDDQKLRLILERMILDHLANLIKVSWTAVIKFSEQLGLSLKDWLVFIDKDDENDPDFVVRLGKQFKADFIDCENNELLFNFLIDAFIFAKWSIHVKSLCIAFGRWDRLEGGEAGLS